MPTVPVNDPFATVVPEPEQIPIDNDLGGEEENCIVVEEEEEEDLPLDDEQYRDLNHNLVGLKLCVLYEDEGGWFDGTITWYNTQLGKLRVLFEDDSDDYISPEDINGVDVFLKT